MECDEFFPQRCTGYATHYCFRDGTMWTLCRQCMARTLRVLRIGQHPIMDLPVYWQQISGGPTRVFSSGNGMSGYVG